MCAKRMGSKSKKEDAGRVERQRKSMDEGGGRRQLRPRKVGKSFEDVRVGEGDASRLIGRRVRVFWPLDNQWYSGLVKSFDVKKKRHHVVYDDGDEEWLELKKERVKILVASGESFGCEEKESSSSSGDGKKRKRGKEGGDDAHSERNDSCEVEGKKSSRPTAPRSKRGASARRSQAKPIAEADLQEGSNANLENIIAPEPNDDENTKASGLFCEKQGDSSVAETDVSKQAEKLDQSATVAEQNDGNEVEPTADQLTEKHLDVTAGDENATGKPGDVKDADQLIKKHNKKHRGKVKPREPVKK